MVASLPADVWIYIAQFIPEYNLRSMLTLNSTFFQLAMDARYSEANFSDLNNAGLKRMRRLKNSAIAHRVRYLKVDLDLSQECEYEVYNNSLTLDTPWEDVIQTMADTVACMTGIIKFYIKWSYSLPSGQQLSSFLTAAWKSFGSNVREVTLKVSRENLPVLLSTAEGIVGPKDLGIRLSSEDVPEEQKDGTALATVLAPFINKISTLRSLSIDTGHGGLQVSPLFRQLRNIPNLERLSLSEDCSAYESELLGLTQFLRNHAATLRHIDYVNNYLHQSPGYTHGWMAENDLEVVVFSNLLSLRFLAGTKRPAIFHAVLQLIRCSAGTLMSLVFREYCLDQVEVNALLSALAPHQTGRFRELELQVDCLSPELIFRLSKTFPRLEKLDLKTTYVTAWSGTGEKDPSNDEGWRALLTDFAKILKEYDFRDWPLRDINITTIFRSDYPRLSRKITQVLAECIPSMRTPKEGQGNHT